MKNSGAGFWGLAIVLALVAGVAAPDVLTAQEEEEPCRLVSTVDTEEAIEKMTKASEAAEGEAQALYAQALEDLASEIEDDSDLTALWLAAEAYIGLGDFEPADALLTRMLNADPTCEERISSSRFNGWATAYNEAIQAYQAGDEEASLQAFLKANSIRKDSRSFNNAGLLYQNLGDDEAALDQFRAAVEADDPSDQARDASLNLAEALRAAGREDEAVAMLRDYAAGHSDDMMAEMNYATALVMAGEPAAAEETFTKLLARDDLDVDQWNQVGVGLYEAEAFERAVTAFERARSLNPYDRDALNNLATAALEAGNAELAAELGGILIERYPYDFDAYTLLANAASQAKDAARALEVIQERGGLAFSLENVQLRDRGSDVYVVEGMIVGRGTDGAGTTVSVPIDFLDMQGEVAATEQLQVVVPASGETEIFQVELTSPSAIAGYRYQRASG